MTGSKFTELGSSKVAETFQPPSGTQKPDRTMVLLEAAELGCLVSNSNSTASQLCDLGHTD